jgi:DNA-binding CsgD family transcriptional regulator
VLQALVGSGLARDDLRPLVETGAGTPEAGDRFRLFDAVLALLSDCAERQPLVLILDDLHRADHASLLLLDFVGPALRDRAVLLVGTLRTTEVAPRHPLVAVVGEPAAGTDVLALQGLDVADTARLAAELAPGSPRLPVEDLHRRSDGNPFFVTELLRLGPGSGEAVPATIGAAIEARVGRLPEETLRVLTLAAVAGRDLRPAVLAVLHGTSVAHVEESLEPAVAGGLVHPAPYGGYRFTHVLVRDALYGAIPAAQRARWHGRMVDVLGGESAEGHAAPSDLASHAVLAVRAPEDRRRAVRLATLAGADARDRLAHEEAADWFERALELAGDSSGRRFPLLMELGGCAGRAGRMPQCRDAFERAWRLASAEGRRDRLAEVALGLGAVVDSAGTVDAGLVRMLEESLDRLDPADRLTRIRLTARLAVEIYWCDRLTEARRRAAEAVAAARRLGDRRALAVALAAQQFALRGPEHRDERLRLGRELVAQAQALGDEQVELQARRFLLTDCWQVDAAAADCELQALDALAQRTRRPMAHWYVMVNRCTRAALLGDPRAALDLVDRTEAFGRRIDAQLAAMYAVVQRIFPLRECGRLAEIEDALRATILRYPRVAAFRCILAVLLAEAGRREESEALVEELVAEDCRAVPRDALWMAGVAMLAVAAAHLGRPAEAAVLSHLLQPHAGEIVFVGVVAWWGAVDHYRGLVATTLGLHDEAERLLRAGLRLHEAWAAVPLVRASLDALEEVQRRRAGQGLVPELTERERQVLRLLADGAANKQIARRLAISVHTVERHVTHVYSKIGARNRAEATAFALRQPD